MSFLAPKTNLPGDLSQNTPGRSTTGSPTELLPLVYGRGRCVVRWQTPVLHWQFRNTSTSSWAFFSCFGWIACGPADEIATIITNGKAYNGVGVFRDVVGGEYYDHVISKETPETFRFFWGLDAQVNYTAYLQSLVRDAAHPMKTKTHPAYRRIFAVAVKDMEAGRADGGNTPPLPQVEIVFHRRSPSAYSFGYAAHGTHPIGIVKDLLTAKMGGGKLAASYFDDAHWTAQMQRLFDDGIAGKKGTDLFLSAVFDQARPVGDHVAEVLSYINGWIYERDGKLWVDWFPNDGSTTEPTGLREISKHERAGDLELDPAGLDELQTKVVATGLDWAADPPLSETSADEQVPYAQDLLQEQRPPQPESRPFIVDRQQLKSYVKMKAALVALPELKATVPVLRQYATHPDNVTPLRPGDRFNLDDDAKGLDLVVRITERQEDGAKVIFKVVGERGAFPQPYQPALDPRADLTLPTPADLARYTVAQLPPDLSDVDETLCAALVERPTSSAVAYEVHLSPSNTWPGQVIATNYTKFAVCAVLRTTLASSFADATMTVDTVGNDWSYFRSQSALEQGDDQLLMYRNGEWFSVGTNTPLGGGSYSLVNVKRARLGSLPSAHAIGNVMFLILRSDLVALSHAEFANIAAGGVYNAGTATKWFKVRPLGAGGLQGNLTAAFSLTLRDPTPAAVNDLAARTGTGKIVELRWTQLANTLVNEYHIYRATGPGFGDEAKIAETGADETRWYDVGVVIGVQYRYRIKAATTDEFIGGFSNSVTATPGVVAGGEVDNTPPSNPGNLTLADSGTYLGDDGTVLGYLLFNVPVLPAGAIGQKVKRRRQGATGAFEDVGTLYGSGTIRQDDLTPGTAYDFGLEAFSFSGATSALVLGTGSPYTAPVRTAGSAAPTGLTVVGPSTSISIPPYYDSQRLQWFAARASWTASTGRDVIGYEYVVASGTDASADAQFAAGAARFTSDRFAFIYTQSLGAGQKVSVRSLNTSQRRSAWVHSATELNSVVALTAGTMSSQNSSDVAVAALKTGSASASSVRQVLATYVVNHVENPVSGGAPTASFNLSLSNRGFTTKPDVGYVQCISDRNIGAYYDWGAGGSTSGNAVIFVFTRDGTNIVAGPYRFVVELTQYN